MRWRLFQDAADGEHWIEAFVVGNWIEQLVADTLGDHVHEFFLRNKWREWREYQSQVTAWELRTNLDY